MVVRVEKLLLYSANPLVLELNYVHPVVQSTASSRFDGIPQRRSCVELVCFSAKSVPSRRPYSEYDVCVPNIVAHFKFVLPPLKGKTGQNRADWEWGQ